MALQPADKRLVTEAALSSTIDTRVPTAVDDAVAGLDIITRPVAEASFATRRLALPASPAGGVKVTDPATGPAPIEVFGGYMWATGSGQVHRSSDEGESWQVYCPSPAGDILRRIIPTDDGEVVVASATVVAKSSGWSSGTPSWVTKVTAYGAATFQTFSVAGNGTKFIVSQYGDRPSSRYAHISVDGGATFTQVWDSEAKWGKTKADGSHLHGCEYDPWSDRFYLTEGHNDTGAPSGVYVSTDDGASWSRPAGLVTNPPPTVMVATDDGLVCGSDHAEAGVWGIVRQDDPAQEVIRRSWAWRTGRAGVIGYGVRGFREPRTGVVYIGFRTSFTDVAPIIAGGTAATASLVWEWPTLPVTLSDDIGVCLLPSPGKIVAHGLINGNEVSVTGSIPGPGAATIDTGGTEGGKAIIGSSLASGANATTGGASLSVAVGVGAIVNAGQESIALGADATADGSSAVVIGASATSAGSTVTVGRGANGSTDGQTVVIGRVASTAGGNSVAVGDQASSQALSTAVGYRAKSSGAFSVAIGNDALTSSHAVAIGVEASAGSSQTAVGRSATAAHTNSVAIGNDTATTSGNQVAFGPRGMGMEDVAAAPVTFAGGGTLYVEDGALKFKGGSGTVTVIGPA